MEWINVVSTNIVRFRYSEEELILEVEFTGGRRYQYFDVPSTIFDGLRTAGSHGSFLNQNIKGTFRYARA